METHKTQRGALRMTMARRISYRTNMRKGSPTAASKCRTTQAISLWGWSSGLCATWPFLWVVSTSLRRRSTSMQVHPVLLPLSQILLQLFEAPLRHYSLILQKDEQLFNHAAAQLGSEWEVCLRFRGEATGYMGWCCLVQIFHSTMCQAWAGQGKSGTY